MVLISFTQRSSVMGTRSLLVFRWGFICSVLIFSSYANSKAEVYYAGFSYLGKSDTVSQNFPYSHALNQSIDGVTKFDREMYQRLGDLDIDHFELIVGELADIQDENAISLTLALESESTSIEKIGSYYKLLIQLSAQIILFDQSSMKLVSVFPIDVQLVDVINHIPTEEDVISRFDSVFFKPSKVNVFDIFVRKLNEINPEKKYNHHIRVLNTNVAKKVEDQTKNWQAASDLSNRLGISFTRFLSDNQQVSVLPFVKGHAIGNKLAGRYANGDVYMMTIPEPDYAIDVTLTGLKRLVYEKAATGTSYIYATELKMKVYEPYSNTVFYEGKFRNGATKKVPKSQTVIDDWSSYNEAILALMDKLTTVLGKPKKSWFKKHSQAQKISRNLSN